MTHHPDCLFCKIIAGDIPADVVYQDEHVVAILDIHPVNPGHLLVLPRMHVEDVRDASDETLANLMRVVKRLTRALTGSFGATGVNVVQNTGHDAGQVIFHLHIHVIPRIAGDGREHWKGLSCSKEEAQVVLARLKNAQSLL